MQLTKTIETSCGVIAAVASGLLFGGCTLAAPEEGSPESADVELASTEQAITAANLTTEAPWVVRLDLPGGRLCSGSVLSEHYILTAGHCLAGYSSNLLSSVTVRWANVAGGAQSLYSGQGWVLRNPQWHEHEIGGDTGEDIAMLQLGGSGVNLALTGRAKLWGWNSPDINRDPWEQSSQNRWFTLIGWGLTGSGSSCTSGTGGSKRIGYGFKVDATSDATEVHAPINTTHACGGDSGAPWLFVRGGQLIAFAVHSSRYPDLIVLGNYHRAPLIKPKRDWMWEASRFNGRQLICSGAGFAGSPELGVTYEECREQILPPPPPPPPSAPCPSGKRCCEPISSTVCGLCWPTSMACP
jgi:hypothetical protein